MDEHPDSALHYGHVGRAIYLPETQTWTFSRSFARPPSISYTGVTKTTVRAPTRTSQPQTSVKPFRTADQQLIPRVLPDLASHWSSIRDDGLSKIITTVTDIYDPQVSSLLDLGYATHHGTEDTRARGPVAIAASVTGECGNIVSFRALTDDTAELPTEGSALRGPSIGQSEVTEWSKRGAPIQQICFARPLEEKPVWMAARLQEATTIFRPLYHLDPVPMHIADDDTAAFSVPLRNSRLDANPVVDISNSHTGGFSHADVAFNPWYPRQLAIVDTRGNWSVWEISGRQRRRRANWAATCVKKGELPETVDKPDANRPRHDGWASIEWVADFSTLLVSDRRCLMLYQLSEGVCQSSAVEIGMTRQSEWILDVQRSAQNVAHFFVLTTSRLVWFDVTTAPPNEHGLRPSLRPRLAWRHFRDPEDTTLRLSDLPINGDLHLVLYSKLTELVQVFPCPFIADEQAEAISIPEPFMLDVPSEVNESPTEIGTPVHYSTFIFREIGHSPPPVGKTYYNPDMKLTKLFWIDSSLGVHESLFRLPDETPEQEDNVHLESSNILRLKKRHHAHRKNIEVDDENFVVDDWDETVAPPRAALHQNLSSDSDLDLQWTLDWTSIYALAVANLAAGRSPDNPGPSGSTFDQLIATREGDMVDNSKDWIASETMLELSQGRPVMEDIDDTAHNLTRLVSTVLSEPPVGEAHCRYIILPLKFSPVLHAMPPISSDEQSSLDFVNLYDRLVHEWVTSLSHDIPRFTCVMKERVIRGIALDILLSRLIRISNTPSSKDLPQTVEATDEHRTEREESIFSQTSSLHLPSSQPPSSQIIVTGEPTSQGPSSNTSKDPTIAAYNGLSTFTTFKKPRTMPRNVANLLSHWELGADPSTYEWQKTSQMLEEEEAQRSAGPSTPRRQRSRRKPQQTAQPEASSLPPTRVAPPIRTWGSQPDNILPALPLPSSQPTVDEVPMTQMERGQFGAREAKKSLKVRKKRRAAGF
ncbi:uncharacterized protein N7482_007628 [Penicillium canariense]|uniref:RNA polymerase I-specific transcription initiation factor RRN6-like protein n=1 Tax=Penicillium canariense TaxID=189055 RepID=A0A9W9LKA8_9EURO|nr:uncharacterized protein N7482_007628 [Penicillium canariense]KAJ5160624.1 hypothetical protein N7482_007628 [Penicillium canariense]